MTSSGELARRLQDQGWRGLLPLLPHDAAPNVRLASDKAAEVEAGRGKAPGRWARAGWSLLPDWREFPDDVDTIEAWSQWPSVNVGMRACHTAPWVAFIDVDVLHVESATEIQEMLRRRLPGEVIWRIGNPPKFLIPVQVTEPVTRSRSAVVEIDGQRHMVEVLGAGQQAVVAGIHPKTGRAYVWPAGGLEETEPVKLPLVTPAELAEILAACDRILLRCGKAVGRKGRSIRAEFAAHPKPLHELRACDLAMTRAAAKYVVNNDWSRDDWVAWAYALRGAFGDAGKDLWLRFSAQSVKATNPATAEKVWRNATQAEIDGLLRSGAGTVLKIAEEEGWTPPTVRGLPPHYPESGLEAAAAMVELHRLLADAVAAAGGWIITREGESPRVGFKVGAGAGKSTALLTLLAAIPGIETLRVEVYVPTHRLADELAAKVRPGIRVLHIEGRNERTCVNKEVTEKVGEAGLNVAKHCCYDPDTKCEAPCFAGCCYYSQFDPAPAIRLFAHGNLFARRPEKLPTPDLIIIDESFWRGAPQHRVMPLDRLVSPSRWRQGKVSANDKIDAEVFSTRVRDAFEQGINPLTVVSRDDCLHMQRIEGRCFTSPNVTPDMPPQQQLKHLRSWQSMESGSAWRFWKLLAATHDHPDRHPQQVTLQLDEIDGGSSPRHCLHLHYRRELTLPKAVPVILIDADLDALIIERLLPGTVIHEIPVRQNAYVVQVVDRYAGTMTSLLGKEGDEGSRLRAQERRDQLEAFLLQMPANGLLVTYKRLLDQKGPGPLLELPDDPELATVHLGNLRGLDAYKDRCWLMIAGRLQPDPWAMDSLTRSMFGDAAEPLQTLPTDSRGVPDYPTEYRTLRMAEGAPPRTVKVQFYSDPRGDALLKQVRECEVVQAACRLRLVHRTEPALVILIANIVVDLTVNEATSWAPLLRNREAILRARLGGIVLHSPAERARAAPDLWATAEAARSDAKREKSGQFVPPLYKEYSYRRMPQSEGIFEVEYRREGESTSRRPAYRASVPGALTHEAAVAMLVERLGEGVIVTPPAPNRRRGRPRKPPADPPAERAKAPPTPGTAAPPAQMADVDILAEADRRLAEVRAEGRRAEERMAREAAAFEQIYPQVEAEAA